MALEHQLWRRLAGDQRPAAPHGRTIICRGELHQLSYDGDIRNSYLGPQHDRVRTDGIAHFSDADPVRVVPCEQQLRAEFNSLLWLPSGCLAKHNYSGRRGTEPYYGRVPDRLFDLPFHCELDHFNFQSRHYDIPVDRCAHDRSLRAVPREWELQRHVTHRLLQLPHCGLAEHHDSRRVGTESHHLRVSNHLRVVPHHDLVAGRGL